MNDADRFSVALSQVTGKRLTYAEVTGKVGETANETSRLEEEGTEEEERLALRSASRSCFSCSIAAFTICGLALGLATVSL